MGQMLSDVLLNNYMQELCRWDAVELIFLPVSDKRCRVLLPYVMNDAVECYLELTDATVLGEWNEEYEGKVSYEFIDRPDDRNGLVFRQGENGVTTIWYDKAYRYLNGYQYQDIGHMWRKEAGEEHLRRLVHLICVIHDKWNFLGEEACNEEELELAALAEFAPLRYWTPINDSIQEWYPDSVEGIEAFGRLAKDAGDEQLCKETENYRNLILQDNLTEKGMVRLAKKLAEPEHFGIYEMLWEKIKKASGNWPQRTYPEAEQMKIDQMRRAVWEKKISEGYTGTYPYLRREDEELFFVEEQPFTVLEAQEYEFRIMELHIRMEEKKKLQLFSQKMIQVSMNRTEEKS